MEDTMRNDRDRETKQQQQSALASLPTKLALDFLIFLGGICEWHGILIERHRDGVTNWLIDYITDTAKEFATDPMTDSLTQKGGQSVDKERKPKRKQWLLGWVPSRIPMSGKKLVRCVPTSTWARTSVNAVSILMCIQPSLLSSLVWYECLSFRGIDNTYTTVRATN